MTRSYSQPPRRARSYCNTYAFLCALLCATVTLTAWYAAAPTANATITRACHPVHVIQAAGTGFSSRADTGDPRPLLFDLWNPGEDLQIKLGAKNVSATSIAYPGSLGRITAFQPGSEGSTYGESVLYGVNEGQRELQEVAASCPDTKYIIVGYSQGASVAGDLAARISTGQVAGVDPAQVAGVVLVADPGRSRNDASASTPHPTTLWGPVPPGEMAAGGEIVNGGGTGVRKGREGMTGARPGNFANLRGKVVSLCHSDDMACSTPPGSLVMEVAQYANRVEWDGPVDNFSGDTVARFTSALGSGASVDEALKESGVGILQAPSVAATIAELVDYYRVIDSHARNHGYTLAQLVAIGLINALPNLAYEGAMNDYLLPAAQGAADLLGDTPAGTWAQVAVETYRLVDATESIYWQLFDAGLAPVVYTPTQWRQDMARGLTRELMTRAQHAAGLDGLADDPAHAIDVAAFATAGDFGFTHVSYFQRGFSIDGQPGYRWANSWLEQVTANAIAGRSTHTMY